MSAPSESTMGPKASAADEPIDSTEDGHEERFDRGALDRRLVRGVAWTGGVKWVTQILAWVSTFVVAGLLTPEDYGVVGMATVYLGLLTTLTEAGFGMTVIAMRDVRGARLQQMHTLALYLGVAGIALSVLAAVPLARFFEVPALAWVTLAMSGNFVLMTLRTVPQAVLQRQLRFGRVALIDGANSLTTAVLAMVLAMLGFRYWSLVIAAVAGSAVATCIALISQPIAFRRPNWLELSGVLTVSRDIMIGAVAWYVFQSSDFFVAGKLLGEAALGAYTFAWTVAYSVVEKITGLVSSVTSSIFSAAKEDSGLLIRYLTEITGVLAIVLLPATVGIALIAEDLLGLIGAKWDPAVAPLRILVLYAGVRSLAPLLSQALTITGDARYAMKRSLIAAVVLPIGFVVGSRWGITGIATAWIVCHAPVVLFPLLRRVQSHLGIPVTAFVPVLRPAVVSSVVMAAAVLALTLVLPPDLPRAVVLAIKIAMGGVSYAACMATLFRARVLALLRLTRQLRSDSPLPTPS